MTRLLLVLLAAALFGASACLDGSGPELGTARYYLGTDGGATACGTLTYQGCCAQGNTYHCQSNTVVATLCPAGKSCGWHPSYNLYVCGGALFADPTGQVAPQCPSITLPDAGPVDSASPHDALVVPEDAATGTCNALTYAGCCDQETLYYCSLGKLIAVSCGGSAYCGWNGGAGRYECGMSHGSSDPSGTWPRQCPVIDVDAGIPGDQGEVWDGSAPDNGQPVDVGSVIREAGRNDGFTLLDSFLTDAGPQPTDAKYVGLDFAGLDVGRLDYTPPTPPEGCGLGGAPVLARSWTQSALLCFLLCTFWIFRRRRPR